MRPNSGGPWWRHKPIAAARSLQYLFLQRARGHPGAGEAHAARLTGRRIVEVPAEKA